VWETVKLAPGKILIPGVISHATNIVEHPELVEQKSSAATTLWAVLIVASPRAHSPAARTRPLCGRS
jgi:hypothetical protein